MKSEHLETLALYASFFTKLALAMGGGVLIGFAAVNQLEKATAHQCATQNWPAHQHDEHVEFCKTYSQTHIIKGAFQ